MTNSVSEQLVEKTDMHLQLPFPLFAKVSALLIWGRLCTMTERDPAAIG